MKRQVGTLIGLMLCLALLSGSLPVSAGPPTPIPDPDSSIAQSSDRTPMRSPSRSSVAIFGSADILLIQTNDPWEADYHYVGNNWYDGITSDTEVLDELEYTYDIADWDDISGGLVDIFSYPVVLIVNDQVQEFYDDYAAHVTEFENYVASGRTLVFFAAGYGWAGGELNADLPGGVEWNLSGDADLAWNNVIVNASHPVVTAELSDGVPLTDADLYSNYCSHGWFSSLPSGTNVILRESVAEGGQPTLIEYTIGNGKVIASTLTWEHNWSYHTGGDEYGTFARKALDDVFLYAFSGGITPSDDVKMSLHIEDAPVGVVVNKVAGDSDGVANTTYVDIVAKIVSYDSNITSNIAVTLTVPSAVLGNPSTSVRTWSTDTDRQSIGYDNVGTGQYRVTTDLSPIFPWWWPFGNIYVKQVIWRFEIPDNPQEVQVEAEIGVPNISLAESHATAQLNIIDHANTIIIANRTLLYSEYDYSEVNELLRQMYTIAQGPPRNQSPLPVVYYMDRHSNDARDWDQDVDYTGNEAQANMVATAIDALIEDWYDDSSEYIPITLPIIGTIYLPVITPDYLLIVGDDDTIPFYRYDDPTDDEGITRFDCDWFPLIKEHPGWCVDSDSNPAIRATDEDYFFTDNPYADHDGGTDWQIGSLELAVGRTVGDSAADMRSLLINGVNPSNRQRGSVVMSSVDGWELGLEPHTGGGTADLYNVPALFTDHGFAVRNDDNPTSEVRTIDVMSLYEGGNNSWNTNFRNAANDASGMDIFFIGGHDSYDRAFIPGDDFSPDDTPGRYTRFGTDHPIAMIVGCHGGLTVPDVDVPGGVDHDMVYDLAHEGASAYIGATGFSYGSPGNLHNCTWGENLIQRFFGELLEPANTRTETIGEAMRIAKNDYIGTGDTDRKTLTEFTVYGIPWQTISYPGGGGGAALAAKAAAPAAFILCRGKVAQVAAGTYSQIFTVDIADYAVTQDQGYDILSVSGGGMDFSDGYPVLPFVEGYTLTLPFSGTMTSVQVVNSTSSPIGTYNVPIVEARPWSEDGTVYTSTTDINYLYPAELVSSQETSEGLVFHVTPIQHNPTTDETIFYNHLEVQVTYEAPLEVTVADFSTDKSSYVPGATISTNVAVANVGASGVSLTATLTIKNALGHTAATQTSSPFTVPSGGSHTQSLAWTGTLNEEDYEAVLTISDGMDTLGGASANFNVLAGEITDFTVPDTVSGYANFQVGFANYRMQAVSVTENIYIYDVEGTEIAKLPQKTVAVGSASEATTGFSWDTTGVPESTYTAVVIATVNGVQYGPVARTFRVERGAVYLPLILCAYAPPAPTWSSTTGLSARTVYALAPDPTNCHTRYAGADDGVYRSTDTGNTWVATGLSGPLITSVAVDPAASQTIYAATWGQGVYKSSNGGTSWSQVNSGLGDELWLYALVLAPDGSLYAGTYDGGVYKSTSGGASWSPVNNGLGDFNIRALAADPNNSQVVYAGTTDGVYKTTNGGASWSATGSGLAGQTVWVLGVHPTSSATIFAGTDNGLYRSTDGGGTWAQVGLAGQRLYAVVVDPLDGQWVYAGSDGGGVYRSTDGGATWTAMNTGLGNLNVQSLALDGGTCHALQTGTEDGVWSYSE